MNFVVPTNIQIMTEQFTFFFKSASPFSQWYMSDFVIKGIQFNCAEQYMMYRKAKLFKDEEMASKILKAKHPRKQKAFGRLVKNFNGKTWQKHCKQIVYDGNYAKFTQYEPIKKYLLKTKGTTLVEASPSDIIWGIGLAEDDPRRMNRSQWRGTNWLGEVLTRLREDLLK